MAKTVKVTDYGMPILCPVCNSEDTCVHYEHLCPNGWTHWWVDSWQVAPEDPADGSKPVSQKCPGCTAYPVDANYLQCNACGEVTPF